MGEKNIIRYSQNQDASAGTPKLQGDKLMNKQFKVNLTVLVLVWTLAIPFSSYGMDGQIKLTQPVEPATFPIVINITLLLIYLSLKLTFFNKSTMLF